MRVDYRTGLTYKPGDAELGADTDSYVLLRGRPGNQVVMWSAPQSVTDVEIESVSGAWQESRSFSRGILRSGKKHAPMSSVTLRAPDATVVVHAEASPAEIRATLGM